METKFCYKCKTEKMLSDFSEKSTICRECKKSLHRKYYLENKEKVLSDCRDYRKLHKLEVSERNKAYREKNKEKIAINSKRWQQNNKEKVKIINKRWTDKNRDKVNARSRRWLERNKDKIKKQDPSVAARWRKNHPQKAKEVSQKYRNLHPEKVREATRRRRMFKKQVNGEHFTELQWNELLSFYGNKCIAPGEHDGPIQRDHVIPITKGGSDSIDNIQPLCRLHNVRKSNKTIDYR